MDTKKIRKITHGTNKAKGRHSVDLVKMSEEFYSGILGSKASMFDPNRRDFAESNLPSPSKQMGPKGRPRRPQNEPDPGGGGGGGTG